MSYWGRIKRINENLDNKIDQSFQVGGFFDPQTYLGCVRWFLLSVIATCILWYAYDAVTYLTGSNLISAKRNWYHLLALIIGGMGMTAAVVGIIMISIRNYRGRNINRDNKDVDMLLKIVRAEEDNLTESATRRD